MSPTQRKLALITGATGGIGKATAVALAKAGEYNLALHYNSASSTVQDEVLAKVRDAAPHPIDVHFFQADLGSFDAVRALHAAVVERLSHPDILFNNAGTMGGISRPQSLAEVSMEVFESSWRVNTGSGILLTQLCLPHMETTGWGRIIFNSSVAGLTGGIVGPHYASSKSAIHGLVHWLAGNVAKKGVTVNAIAPALIVDTVMLGGGGEEEEVDAKFKDVIPVGRGGRSEEIAQTVLWMINCGYVTNKVIAVDGGMYPY